MRSSKRLKLVSYYSCILLSSKKIGQMVDASNIYNLQQFYFSVCVLVHIAHLVEKSKRCIGLYIFKKFRQDSTKSIYRIHQVHHIIMRLNPHVGVETQSQSFFYKLLRNLLPVYLVCNKIGIMISGSTSKITQYNTFR